MYSDFGGLENCLESIRIEMKIYKVTYLDTFGYENWMYVKEYSPSEAELLVIDEDENWEETLKIEEVKDINI